MNVSDSDTVISGLTPSTNYSIEVAAMNSADTGLYSAIITVETDDGKGKPCKLGHSATEMVGVSFINCTLSEHLRVCNVMQAFYLAHVIWQFIFNP